MLDLGLGERARTRVARFSLGTRQHPGIASAVLGYPGTFFALLDHVLDTGDPALAFRLVMWATW